MHRPIPRVLSSSGRRCLCCPVIARGPAFNPPPKRFNSYEGKPRPAPKLVGLDEMVGQLQSLWRRVTPQKIRVDPTTGICLAPQQPRQLGRPIRVLTNHLMLTTSASFTSSSTYRVTISQAASSSVQQPNAVDIALSRRQELLAQLAAQEKWPDGSWQYDPSSQALYSHAPGSLTGQSGVLQATISLPGSGKSTKQQQSFDVTVTYEDMVPPSVGSPVGPGNPSSWQLLSLLTKASLQASIQKLGGVEGARSGLLPPGMLLGRQGGGSPGAASSGGRGGRGGGRDGGRGGRGGGSGRGRGPGAGDNFPGVLQFWDSVSTAIKPTQLGVTLQVNTSAGAALPGQPLGSLLTVPSTGTSPSDLTRNKKLLAEAQELIKGAKVQLSYFSTGAQTKVVKGLDARPATRYTFKDNNGQTTTVAAYYKRTYGITLKHGDTWPCVMISKTAAVPMELCEVLPTQRKKLTEAQTADLIRVAALPPERRLQAYSAIMQKMLSGWKLFREWGVDISKAFMQVDGRVLPDTALQYANSSGVEASNQGQWRPGGRATLLAPARLKTWAVLNMAPVRCSTTGVREFVDHLMSEMRTQGMQVQQPFAVVDGSQSSDIGAGLDALQQRCAQQLQLVLVVLPTQSTPLYKQVKEAALQRGVVTQCLVTPQAKISRDSAVKNVPYLNNLLLKINTKLGGTNWQLPADPSVWAPCFGTEQLMVVGIDVSHGVTGSTNPSVAAVVASHDPSCTQYSAALLEQTAGHEVVLGMREAMTDLLQGYYSNRGQLPEAILVFRDGVSDSQYPAVLQQEVADIKAACTAVAGTAFTTKVTYLVVSRNHGTRLFPVNPRDSLKGNVQPGTVVDTQLVAPLRYEFFLNAHAGIQGTNKPARINVLVDENNLGPDGNQLLAFHLSSIYCVCSRTVSAPAPARYADKAARAGSFMSSGGQWQVVQPAQPGMQQLQYRMLTNTALPSSMWYV